MRDKERRLWSPGLRFEVVVRGDGLDAESRGKNRETPFPVLKAKCWGGGRCIEEPRELSCLGLAVLGHLKITSSLKSKIEGSAVC